MPQARYFHQPKLRIDSG